MHTLQLDWDIWHLGRQYIEAPHHTFSAAEKVVICAFSESQWQADIVANGVYVRFVDFQPYRSVRAMAAAIQATGELLISTRGNVKAGDDHPLTPELNLKHRAVHDWHHVTLNAGFNAPGEITTCAHMVKLARDAGYPMFVQLFLFGEMVGQTGHFYATRGEYANQKVSLFEPELIDELVQLYTELGAAGLLAYLTPIDKAARERHGWETRSAH